MDFLDDLNDAQKQAVTSKNGPLLILAGAGSGKTRVLTYRIAYLIKNGLNPSRILAVTFTNKAADAMKGRLKKIIGRKADSLWIGTFHSICARILRTEIPQLGYKNSFSIYDDYDRRKLIEQCLKDLNLDVKKHPSRAIAHLISAAKNELIDSETFRTEAGDYKEQVAGDVYKLYQERLFLNNAVDFDDLLMLAVNILELNPETLKRYQEHFQHVFVDEYQDTNKVQYVLTRLLAQEHNNICVVGDSDQSIYRWRGADIRNILNFEKDYSNNKVVILEQNYRSTQKILEAANVLISNNSERKPKNLWTAKDDGDLLTVFEANDEHQEAYFVAKTISHYLERGGKCKDFAVFYRVNAQSRVLEEAFLREGLPYKIIGGLKFYERQEIKDILAYLRVLVNENDSVSLQRIINRPRRGLGETTIALINKYCNENNVSFYEALKKRNDIGRLSQKARDKIGTFLSVINKIKDGLNGPLTKIITTVLEESGYLKSLKENEDIESQNRIDNLNEFLNVVKEFEGRHHDLTLQNFLEEISLITDVDKMDDAEDSVTLMTMHNAKGLEFEVVFVTGMEEGLFPHSRSLYEAEELEEERRLCYVSLTRAMKKLYLSSAYSRNLYGTGNFNVRSRFLAEIPADLMEVAQAPSIQPVEDGQEYGVGDVVEHKKFGRGIVTEIEDDKISIQFENSGPKTLLMGYAPITLVK